MSEKKPVEAISSSEPTARVRSPEPVAMMGRTQERRAEGPEPPPVPVEPSPAFRPYRVLLDPETRRLFTEVIDTRTGNVLLRIPPGYAPSEALDESSKEIEL